MASDAPSAEGDRQTGAPTAAGGSASAAPTSADATRAISEADVVQLDNEQLRIYAMSRSGSLAIVDAAQPGQLTLLGKASLSGEPFEMYRRGDVLLALSNRGVAGTGQVKDPLPPDEGFTIPAPDPTASALLSAVDVTDPAQSHIVGTFRVPGEIADSRIVGSVLYLVTYENASCFGCGAAPRTVVTTFDVSNPLAPKQIDQTSFAGATSNYKRSVVATKIRLYVGGLANDAATTTDEGVIDVLDISDPSGRLVRGAKISTAGPITSRWQMDESDGVLRVISERGVTRTATGEKFPDIDTFRIESTSSIVRIGHTTMTLPRQEALKTVRFDGVRAYAITFAETDPLFTIDLSDPTAPAQRGQLVIPGWMVHLEPRGDRLIGLGLDRRDGQGSLNVSLFDVANLAAPVMLERASFGPTYVYTDAQITGGVLAEDQDRIQKAFRIFQDGLIAVPFSPPSNDYGGTTTGNGSCGAGGGIQLLSWTHDSLTKHALVPLAGNPRRAVRRDSEAMHELIGISDTNVRSFAIDRRDAPTQTADVVIGTCTPRSIPQGDVGRMPEDGRPAYGDYADYGDSSCF